MGEAKQKLAVAPQAGWSTLLARPAMGCLLLAVTTLLVYWPVQSCDFITIDDPLFIARNPHVQAGLSGKSLLWALGARVGAIWHPVTTLTYLLDAELFGRDPTGPHIINLLWHVANSVLLFLVLREMTGAYWRSLVVAAFFALHPLRVESVAWVAERKDVVSTCFGLLALWAYTRYARSVAGPQSGPKPTEAPRPGRWYALTLGLFLLGLLSKPMLVTLPCLFLLLDYWPLRRLEFRSKKTEGRRQNQPSPKAEPSHFILHPSSFRLLFEKLPFFLLASIAGLIAVWAQQEGGALQPLSSFSIPARLANTLVAYARYLGKLFWPTDLALPYPPAPQWAWETVGYAAALLAGLSVLALWLAPRRPFALTGWLWFLGTLVPVIGLVQVSDQSLADRYTYLPSIGLFLVLSWGTGALVANRPALTRAAAALALVLVGACALLTRAQLRYWQDSGKLFTHALAVTGDNWLACYALGVHQAENQRHAEAIALYQRALKLRPSAAVLNSLGMAWVETGHYADAIQCFEAALRLEPGHVEFHSNLGAALDKAGRSAEALAQFHQALQLGPDALTHYRLANTLTKLGQVDQAIAHYRLAVQYQPYYPQALNQLALALFNQGKLPEAIGQFHAALAQNPDDPDCRCNLGQALAAQHNWDEAAQQYAAAARLKPELVDAHYGLARMLLQLGRRDEALEQLREVLQRHPGHAAAQQQLEALQSAGAK